MQIDERRRINGITAVEVVRIDLRQAAVDNRLVHGFELACTAHDLFDKGQHELALCNQRVRRIAVAQRQVHSVDMVWGSRRQIDRHAAKRLNQRCVLILRIGNDDFIVRAEEN